MKNKIILPLFLVVMGLILAALSIPYISEDTVLGIIGVAGGLLVCVGGGIRLVLAARSGTSRDA